MKKESIIDLDRKHVWHPYTQELTAPPPMEIVKAKGAWLTAADGKQYLDLISSWWVNLHGHAHPLIAQAIAEQAARLEQVIFAGFTHAPAVRLAKQLTDLFQGKLSRVFYSDDGSTAVEVALKMALQFWQNKGEDRTRFIAFEGGYHGDTAGAMSAGKSSGFFDAFKPMMFQVDLAPFPQTWLNRDVSEIEADEKNSLDALDALLEKHEGKIAGAIIEPLVQGASGMKMCRPEFLQKLYGRLNALGIPLILDEVMTGFGRTGKMFAHQKADVTPDIICLSKGLTGGFLPLSVTICKEELYKSFLGENFAKALAHGHSFTANPLGCAAALASLDLFETENTLARITEIEKIHLERITALPIHSKNIKPRVCGTIAALDFPSEKEGYCSETGPKLKNFFMEKGLMIRPLGNVLYLLPPYCITDKELHQAWDAINDGLSQLS